MSTSERAALELGVAAERQRIDEAGSEGAVRVEDIGVSGAVVLKRRPRAAPLGS